MSNWLEPADFATVIRLAPLGSIDLVLRDPDGMALLGYRTFEPAKGLRFVPGGRIGKNETLVQAFGRILSAETGLDLPLSASRLLGVYDHFYDTNRFEQPGYGTHYVVIGRELRLDSRPDIRTDDQHSAMRWMTPADILAAPDVHENTKTYFRAELSQ